MATATPATTKSTALATIDPKTYSILDPASTLSAETILANLAGEKLNEFDLDMIKVPAGGGTRWSVPTLQGEQEAEAVEGIIVHVAKRRTYWESGDIDGSPPDCYSRDMVTGIGNPGGPCDACPLNQFGSADKGKGKACKETRSVFLVRTADTLPVVLRLPPSSLQGFKKYLLKLTVPYFQCVTRFRLKKEKNDAGIVYSEAYAEAAGVLGGDAVGQIREYAQGLGKVFG